MLTQKIPHGFCVLRPHTNVGSRTPGVLETNDLNVESAAAPLPAPALLRDLLINPPASILSSLRFLPAFWVRSRRCREMRRQSPPNRLALKHDAIRQTAA